MHDLVVVGAGPSGSQLAWQAAENGADVLVLEEHDRIGEPLACSGHLSTKIWDLVPRNDELIENIIHAGVLHINGRDYEFRKKDPVSFVLCREELDRYINRLATEAGAETRLNSRVTGFTQHDDHVTVEYADKETGETRTVETRMLAGADGPGSLVRRELGIKDPKTLTGVFCYADEKDDGDSVELWFELPDFFAWRIPRGDVGVEYGLATEKASARQEFERFMEAQNAEPVRMHAGAIPYGLLPRVHDNRVFLVGDAASQVKPFTGGGIVYGMTAARIAAETIDFNDPATLRDYERGWRKALGKEIKTGGLVKKAYATPLLEPLVYFASKLDHEKMHMDLPTSVLEGWLPSVGRRTSSKILKGIRK